MSEAPASAAFDAPAFFSDPRFAPPASKLLGWKLESFDQDAGTIALSFNAKPDFTNPSGAVQGGFLAAMLDDTMGPSVVVKSGGRFYAPTLTMNLNFLLPVFPGPVRCEARCVRLGKTIASMEGVLYDSAGAPAVTASCCSRVIPFEKTRTG